MSHEQDNDQKVSVVLASGSATRASVLREAGVSFSIHAAAIDETVVKNSMRASDQSALETAQALADLKASQVSSNYPNALAIGGDQILACGPHWLDKPKNLVGAREQLLLLRGQEHQLLTAVSAARAGKIIWQFCATSELVMRDFSDDFLDNYLESEKSNVCKSVGGYRLEGPGIQLFSRIGGVYFDILGLPLVPLLNFLRQQGVIQE